MLGGDVRADKKGATKAYQREKIFHKGRSVANIASFHSSLIGRSGRANRDNITPRICSYAYTQVFLSSLQGRKTWLIKPSCAVPTLDDISVASLPLQCLADPYKKVLGKCEHVYSFIVVPLIN
jgi:hypothetical protein